MANSINGVNGGGSSYNIGWNARRNDEGKSHESPEAQTNGIEQTPVDPQKIMEFLANNNYFVAPTDTVGANVEVDDATKDRIAGYMEQFEMIYSLIAEEFGEEKAPAVMDYVMDYLMDMAA